MVLLETNKEEVKEILKQYTQVSKEKKLSFEEIIKRNIPLNELLKEVL
jgi:hypothetical protein